MAFLDNSGDIILDAVLTDSGRFRLAKGDGSFKIVKYAFADDEIDYAKYNKDHLSGSAYYDLDILKTPVLEAFTNNTSNMKHRLLSIPRTNLLYLPTLLLNEKDSPIGFALNSESTQAENQFVVFVDEETQNTLHKDSSKGLLMGATPAANTKNIIVDQGLNTTAISHKYSLDPDLNETRYIVEIDNRLGAITNTVGQIMSPNFIDDDNIASYVFTTGVNSTMVQTVPNADVLNSSPIQGPRGTRLKFSIAASVELNSSTYLFTKLGSSSKTFKPTGETTTYGSGGTGTVHTIDTTIRVTGGSTGRSLDIPVRFLKYQAP
jgi:hypothetical protein